MPIGLGITCNVVQNINRTECIGNSLPKINGNFSAVNNGMCELTNEINNLRTLLVSLSANAVPVGSVVNTHYVDLLGPQTRTGNTVVQNSFSPDPNFQIPTLATGHEILSKTVALTNPNNYFIIQENISVHSDGGGQTLVMVFAGSTLIAAQSQEAGFGECMGMTVKHAPGNTNNITYSVRAAAREGYGVLNINKNPTLGGRYPTFWPTGKQISSMLIQEIKG